MLLGKPYRQDIRPQATYAELKLGIEDQYDMGIEGIVDIVLEFGVRFAPAAATKSAQWADGLSDLRMSK